MLTLSVICLHKKHYSRALIIFSHLVLLTKKHACLFINVHMHIYMRTFPYEGVWNPGDNLDVLFQEGHLSLETCSS